ncbi:MAG TPA: alpha-L-fucosidase, partial [Candidatus Acidoferrales bacterium]|nr:alpha-L-fucosidase [Candidatus Acidoferrales bacterium]
MRRTMELLSASVGALIITAVQSSFSQLTPIVTGPFKPDWNSLTNYECPEWFRDAKFGIWAHWGPQCQPEHGDWYARAMYQEGSGDYKSHLAEYGHPSTNGFKDVIHVWKAEHFDPDRLLRFYKDNGAKYFMALAAHCDNFDLFHSTNQPWNSVALGPHKDLIGMWAAAARKNGLRFGVSLHNGGWTWRWFEPAQGADTNGPLAGVPYDGKLTKADGKGLWWEGLDPQDLYCQNHAIGAPPTAAYCENFCRRALQLWDDYRPDLIYFDDTAVPLRDLGVSDVYGLNLYAHFYNSSIAWHGANEAVITAKGLPPEQRKALVYDIERGKADGILPEPWQTDTCIGYWHYDRSLFNEHHYKTAAQVIPMLADIVSKNGNLMLSVPVRADGTIDADEEKIVAEIGAWLKLNGEAIYATRPWKIYGEGPAMARQEAGEFGGQKDISSGPLTSRDIRFTQSKDKRSIYAIVLHPPAEAVKIMS